MNGPDNSKKTVLSETSPFASFNKSNSGSGDPLQPSVRVVMGHQISFGARQPRLSADSAPLAGSPPSLKW
ncbi:hypothetical protein Y032_0037g3366 [Ancylostoma ceylanicum]|uniref:Uncharacterized protein n=1 Tax=Ancylostoma ceylanicum TaxID=53326 RepID=A0A016UK18_9BILA|nr:hypothetical protein Y032_0037g3366 [Ancylostoma ceylanicum]